MISLQKAFKILDKGFKSGSSIHVFILLAVCGLINIQSSGLKAEELHAHPGSIVFNAVEGHALAGTRSVFIFSSLGTTINWSQSKDVSWLTSNVQNGVTDGVLKIGVKTTGMSSGIYYGNVTIQSGQSTADPVIVAVTLIINPDVPVKVSTWKDGYGSAMSVSVDDAQPSGFDELESNGFSGTYVTWGTVPPAFYKDYYNAGMELGSHTVNHLCGSSTDDDFRSEELEPNIHGIYTYTPEPNKDVISFAWPCGYTNFRMQAVASDYFLSSRGYNINQLEEAIPENFMNLKSYNSHEHTPFPPSDLKTVVDAAVSQHKWFNLVLHNFSNDDGAISYAHSNDIWVTSIGTVIKYILQRERFILTDYIDNTDNITFEVSRSPVPPSALKNFEAAFGPNDLITLQIDIDDSRAVEYVSLDGVKNPYQIKDISGNNVLVTNVKLGPGSVKSIELKYLNQSTIGITVSGVTANNKVYNGTTAATLHSSGATLVGVESGDVVTLISSGASGVFADKNAGTSKTVLTSGFSLSGIDAGKYTLITPIPVANITKANLTSSGVTANDKVYDGTSITTVDAGGGTLTGVFGTDNVRIISSGATGTFVNKNVGTNKSVSIFGLTLGGTDRGNYTLIQPSSSADITKAELNISGVAAYDKVYDRTTEATLNTGSAVLTGVFGSDNVTLVSTDAIGTFADENIGTDKTVTTDGFTLAGTDAGNYTLIQPETTASITKIGLTVSGVTANNKVYNRTTAALLNTGSAILVGVYGGDIVTLKTTGATGSFANKNAGNGKAVSISGFSLGGANAGNYTLTQPAVTADITKANLTVSGITVNNKVYDGLTAGTLNTGSAVFSGVYSGDVVTLVSSGAIVTFVNKNAGTGKSVTISGLTTGGTDGANYTLTQPTATANISTAGLSITGVTANNKIYNASTTATLNKGNASLAGVFGTDIVILNSGAAAGIFFNKNTGTGKGVTISGFTIGATDSGNYALTQPTATANITTLAITVTGVTANNKVYNGTTSATLNSGSAILSGVFTGDIVNLISSGASGTFSNKNAGTGKTVTATGFSLGGGDSGNYTLIQPTLTSDINKASLTVTGVTASNKVYDGTTSTTLKTGSATLIGVLGGDIVNLLSSAAGGTFSDKNTGAGKIVSATGFALGGSDAGNYTLTQPVLIAGISSKALTVIAKNLVKPYGTALAFTGTEYSTIGLVPGDGITSVILSSPGVVVSANIGTYDISAGGGVNSNYSFTYVNGKLTVNKSLLTVKAEDKTRVYGSDNPSLTITYTGFANGEDVSVIDALAVAETDADKNSDAGNYDIRVSGAHDSNYNFVYYNGTLSISKADQAITFSEIPRRLRMTQESQLNATASSGLTVSFSTSDPGIGRLDGDILTISKEGHLTVNASQTGDKNWNAAPDVLQTIETLPTFDGISSLFTPNNDGMNDYWYIPDLEQYGKLQVTVYNRFGQTVYRSDGYKNNWDGTWNGYPLPSASYYYIINSSAKGFVKGVVNIVR